MIWMERKNLIQQASSKLQLPKSIAGLSLEKQASDVGLFYRIIMDYAAIGAGL